VIWESFCATVLGLALSWAAIRSLADRLPSARAVYLTGAPAALFGAYLTHAALGPGHVLATLIGAASVGAVTLSLLIRPRGRRLARSATAQ
jgi:multisubunit Na+/H+ antiporter MnhB subunit